VSKKSKTPIQFQQPENNKRTTHEAIIQEGTQQERARKSTRRERKRQTEDSLKSPLSVTLCLSRARWRGGRRIRRRKKYLR